MTNDLNRQWKKYSDTPEIRVSSEETGSSLAVFHEALYPAEGSWDFLNTNLHFAHLMNSAIHKSGKNLRIKRSVIASTAVSPPGTEIKGGWEGAMVGRHLFIAPDDVSSILDDSFEPRHVNRHTFSEASQSITTDPIVEDLLRLIFVELTHGAPSGGMYFEYLASSLVAHSYNKERTVSGFGARHIRTSDRMINQAIDLMHSRLGGKLLLIDLSREYGVSVPYFCKKFRESTGTTPHKFITNLRIDKAKSMITQNSLTLSQIALDCGFSDQSQFTNTFKKVTRLTPSQYKNSTI